MTAPRGKGRRALTGSPSKSITPAKGRWHGQNT